MKKYTIMASLGANNSSNSVIVEVTDHNGKPIFAEITQKADVEKAKRLKPLVQQGDVDALWDLAEIVEKYDYIVASLIITNSVGDEGAGLCMMGEGFEKDSNVSDTYAFKAFELSAKADNICGMCHLGRCYAEGKGCKKNKILAKKWLTEAATECPDADKYIDQYGLR